MWHWFLDLLLVACLILFMFDKLTFLWVRRCYDLFYSLVVRTGGYIVFIDIDNFGVFNTKHGHKVGDRILREVGKVLLKKSRLRAFRYGGDELAILLPWSSKEYAARLAQGVRSEVERSNINGLKVTVTCVVARYEEGVKNLLREGKENGKNQVIVEFDKRRH